MIGFGHYQLGAALTTNSVQNGWYWGSPVGMNYATNTVAAVGRILKPPATFLI